MFKDKTAYWSKIVNQYTSEASTGTPRAVIKVEILAELGKNAEGESVIVQEFAEGERETREIYHALTEKAVPIWWKAWSGIEKAAKDDGKTVEWSGFEKFNEQTPDLFGLEVEVWCKHSTYNGNTRDKFSISSGGSGPKPVEAKSLRALDAMFKPPADDIPF